MSYPSVPNTFSNGAGNIIDATAINQNFTALVNGLSDGVSSLHVHDIDASGTVNIASTATINSNMQVVGKVGIGTTNPDATVHVVGDIHVTGQIYTTDWTEYSNTSTITGWSSLATKKEIWYRRVGSLVQVGFELRGTSDATGKTFTLPILHANENFTSYFPCQTYVELPTAGAREIPARGLLAPNDSTVYFAMDWADATFFDSSAVHLMGYFQYPA